MPHCRHGLVNHSAKARSASRKKEKREVGKKDGEKEEGRDGGKAEEREEEGRKKKKEKNKIAARMSPGCWWDWAGLTNIPSSSVSCLA